MIRLTCFALFISSISAHIIVQTTSGGVEGKLVRDKTTGTSFYSFLGIPYAEAPTGERRYMPPVPKHPWQGIRDATKPGPVCPQREEYYTKDQMSEDCLVYNVFVPANRTSKLTPVVCVIHGGNFDSESGNPEPIYGPELFVRDSVVVTFNYRLGALGFLSMCNKEVSGNAGLKDAVLALKTIHRNIKKFGGDPTKINIYGNGAPAVIIQFLMLFDETKHLFSRTMFKTGSIFSSKYMQLKPRQNALSLAREMKIKYKTEAELIEKLKSANAFDIVKAQEAMIKKHPQRGYFIDTPFTPTVETDNEYAIVKDTPLAMMRKRTLCDIPMLIGLTNQEGLDIFTVLQKEPQHIKKFNKNFELLIPQEFEYPEGSEARKNLAARIKKFYFGDGDINFTNIQNYINLISDSQYIYPVDCFVKLLKEKKKSNVYYYFYSPDTELNYLKARAKITYPGCAQTDETGYDFMTAVTRPLYKNLSAPAKATQEFSLQAVKNFTHYGTVPIVTGGWPEATNNRQHVYLYSNGPEMIQHRPYPERMDFWDSIYKEFYNCEDRIGSYFCTNDDNHSLF